MDEFDRIDETMAKMKKEIEFLEKEVEMQAYISGLWLRYFRPLKSFVETNYPDTPLEEMIESAVMESDSWEDISEWVEEAREAERQFFERIEPYISDKTDAVSLRTEINFLKGVVRALLSTRETRLESYISEFKDWKKDVSTEIKSMLKNNNLICLE
ncbi:MAG: hypothetical protein Q4F84_11260 [Fibrobacter sp.]|nr:hypothetical protein [Fibrobacter sp.]